mmetsp:Transcript_59/g.94  ORF Transcript_59/g.94 Transcript_59/m.94 type:complete len:225 (-) Transcript_59:1101-1775(-)
MAAQPKTVPRHRLPMDAGPVGLAWKAYLGSLKAKPIRTKSITSAVIAGLSDCIAQRVIHGRHRSFTRTLCMVLYGLVWNGPSAHYWQTFMEWLFDGKSDLGTVLRKVLLDQTSYGPVCNILFMSFATLVLEGKTTQFLQSKLKYDYPKVQINGWKVWPLAALINYKFVPLEFRVLFINMVALCWSTYLLLRARKMATAATATAQQAQVPGEQEKVPEPVARKGL